MREFKFRAWNKKFNRMKYWDFEKDGSGIGCFFRHSDMIPMQYTGLKDKNGKEIYEGDILKQTYHTEKRDEYGDHEWISFDGHHVGAVVITARGVCLKNPLHYSMDTDETKPMNAYKQVAGYRSEVIGNIYEHSHLLED